MDNLDFQLVYANKAFFSLMKEMTGEEKKLNESVLFEGFGNDYIEKWKSYYNRAFTEDYFEIEEYFYQPEANEVQYGQTTFEPLKGDDHKIFAVACQSKDSNRIVKERKRVEQELILSEKKYKTLFEDNPLPMLIFDFETLNIIDCNEEALFKYGYTREEFLQLSIRDIRPKEDIALIEEFATNEAAFGQIHKNVWRHSKKNGELMQMEITAHLIDFNGRKASLASLNDVTEKLETQKAILQSNERFNYVNQVTNDAIYDWDVVNDSFTWTESFNRIFNYPVKDDNFTLASWIKLMHPDDVEPGEKQWELFLTDKNQFKWENEFRFQRGDNSYAFVEEIGYLIRDDYGKPKRMIGVLRDQTQRKNQEQACEMARIGSWEMDMINQDGDIMYWSPLIKEILEVDDSYDTNLTDGLEFCTGESNGRVKKAMAALINEGVEFDEELLLLSAKGNYRWIRVIGKSDRIENKCIKIYGSFQDIDERKKAEQEIRDSEEKRRLIMSGALDAIICIDTKGTITFWNQQAEVIFGWREAEVMGEVLSELIVPEPYRKYHNEGMKHYLETGEGKILNILLELTAIRQSGEEFPIELTVLPIEQEGIEVFFCAFIRDITQRRKAAESILQSNERFEKVTEATNDAIWDWNIVNKTYYRSKGIERFFGKEASGLFPESDLWSRKHFYPNDLIKIKDSFYEAIENPLTTRWEEEYRIINQAGETFYVIDRGVIIRNNKGKAIRVVGAMTDISEQKQMTLQLSELNRSLEQYTFELERSNEELEQFAFVASHDLQEPLRMISSFMELLQRKYGDLLDEKGHQYIHFATDGAKRMKQIILDLLDYSRAGKPTEGKEAVDMNEVLSVFKQLRRKLISEKNAIIISKELPTLNSNKAAITQVFHCLLDNALKYSTEGLPPIVEINAVENENEWEFSIKDNGIGIDSQFYDKIFIIFQRLHNKDDYAGTGIGLSIAKRHVEFLGGRIWLESITKEGTVFYFTIPKTR